VPTGGCRTTVATIGRAAGRIWAAVAGVVVVEMPFLAGVDRFVAKDAAYSTRGWNAGISAYRNVGRMTLSAGLDLGRLKADDRLLLLPEARADRLTRFSVGTVFRQLTFAGFAPVARLIVERNRSTVEFYDFKRVRTEFGISRAF